MTKEKQIQDLLEQLHDTFGIRLAIADSSLDEDETIASLQRMVKSYGGKRTKEEFLRALLLGELRAAQIDEGIRQYHIPSDVLTFPILLTTTQSFDADEISVIRQYFYSGDNTLVVLDATRIVLLHSVRREPSPEEMLSYVSDVGSFLEAETMIPIAVSYDGVITSLHSAPQSFLNISSAAEIGHIFYPERHIFWAKDLGLGQLIYHLPKDVCEEYLRDHFNGIQVTSLDEQTRTTISVFLDSGLNIAECSRRLYLHRNTLIYRLDKIQEMIGLDIRQFDDAMTCKVAILISTYLLQDKKGEA